jgi:hypothetical protein
MINTTEIIVSTSLGEIRGAVGRRRPNSLSIQAVAG